MRSRHILRLQQGDCSIVAGFVWSDLLTNLERTSDHCSNIAGCVMDMSLHTMSMHESLRALKRGDMQYKDACAAYAKKYHME